MTPKSWALAPESSEARRWTAHLLLAVSRSLAHWARHVGRDARRGKLAPAVLEFYADASAPEGALYIDGQLVGHVQGVRRL